MLHGYREVLAIRTIRTAAVLGFLGRLPYFGAGLVVTLHVVRTMGLSYAEAGVATAMLVLGMGVSAPWRGRLLDRHGLRRVVLPSIFVQAAYAIVAPQLDYAPFLITQLAAGLFSVPMQSVIRQAVIAAAPDKNRRAALSLDAIMLEISAGLAPAIAVALATALDTSWVLAGIFAGNTLAAIALFVTNLPLRRGAGTAEAEILRPTFRSWFGPAVLALLAGGVFSTILFAGVDLAAVATLNDVGQAAWIGLVMALWSLGSLVGGLIYGSLHRSMNPFLLLAAMGLASMLPAVAPTHAVILGLLLFVPGLLGQPTLTSTIELLVDRVPEAARGEAMGWHGTAMTTGLALGAPIAGVTIDRWGGQGGFITMGLIGVVTGLAMWLWGNRFLKPAGPAAATGD